MCLWFCILQLHTLISVVSIRRFHLTDMLVTDNNDIRINDVMDSETFFMLPSVCLGSRSASVGSIARNHNFHFLYLVYCIIYAMQPNV